MNGPDTNEGSAKKKPPLYLVNGGLASCVLYFVLRLSREDRGPVDWVVISLVVLAVLWNLVQAGRQFLAAGGGRELWHLLRTLLFWIGGLLNTVLLRPEDVGGWKNGVGWVLLAIAAFDTVWLVRKEMRIRDAETPR